MRILLTILIMSSSAALLAQAEVPTNMNNSNSEGNNFLEEEEVMEVEADTVMTIPVTNETIIEVEDTEFKQVEESAPATTGKKKQGRGKLKKASVKSERMQRGGNSEYKVDKDEAAEEEIPVMDAEKPQPLAPAGVMTETNQTYSPSSYQSASYDFQSTKKNACTQRTQRSPSVEQQMQMDAAVTYFQEAAPSSFEHHYFKYVAGNHDVGLYDHLKKAEELRPENADVHVQLAAYHIIKNDIQDGIAYCDKLKESERLTENVITYAEDILKSTPENGTLITHGFDDSYGTWYAQNKNDVRKDVTLVSLDFLQSDHYRTNLQEKGYKLPESEVIDVDYLDEFCVDNESKSIGISLTTPKEYFEPILKNLYVVGLVYEYHQEAFDNFFRNDQLWNEELTKKLIDNPIDEKGKQLSANYLPMLLQLQKVYKQKGEKEKRKKVDEASDKIAVQSKKYEQVQRIKSSYGY